MKKGVPRLFGWELFELRKTFGYRAREFARYLQHEHAPITSARSVYRLESEREVPLRYVELFRKMVGPLAFDEVVEQMRQSAGHYGWRYRSQLRWTAEKDREARERESWNLRIR